jgi:glycosyltransferase involved in cell wall biosynthesis
MQKLAIVATHPVQYNAPWFSLLSQSPVVEPKVFYTWGQSAEGAKYDPGFGKIINWDIPLLEGYNYRFVKNTSDDPGSHHFRGIINPALTDEIRAWYPDAIMVIGWSFHSHLQCIRYFHKRIPVFFRGDSTLLDEKPGIKKFIRRSFLKWVYSQIDYAFYVGQANKNYFMGNGIKEHQLFFAPHAIDNNRFAEPSAEFEKKALDERRNIGINDNDLVLLFAGKLEEKKNPALLLELARTLPDENLKFIIVGNGQLESKLKENVKDDERIIFLDFQNQQQMPVVYRMGDVFILPSKGPGETWGLAVNEAMACSRPVMVSERAGCAADLVKQRENGIIFDPENIGICVSFLKDLLQNRGRIKIMGKASFNIIQGYSFGGIISSVENVMKRVAQAEIV